MDLSDEKGSGSIDRSRIECGEERRSCADCHTTTTPLWRGGPSGPKSLCNACGIRYRKKRREALGLEEGGEGKEEKREEMGGVEKFGVPLKLKMLGFGREVAFKQRSMIQKGRRRRIRRMGEEEQAAVLLMALSSGFLHA
ncbi:GATA transcription factor 15-like [Typha angustifolia]|uniref:GATA transcription factor 15-like n=1 Tax=Typha angustifolia TaxID=59011 RepID=UPI003C2D56DC